MEGTLLLEGNWKGRRLEGTLLLEGMDLDVVDWKGIGRVGSGLGSEGTSIGRIRSMMLLIVLIDAVVVVVVIIVVDYSNWCCCC